MLDRRGVGKVQRSQEDFGLEPFRNCVSFWQNGLSTENRTKAPRPWPCSVRANQEPVVLPRASSSTASSVL